MIVKNVLNYDASADVITTGVQKTQLTDQYGQIQNLNLKNNPLNVKINSPGKH